MRFQTLEELRKVSGLLVEADFERAESWWEASGGILSVETTRALSGGLKGAGLFRKAGANWVKCRLLIRGVRRLSLWEEYDVKPPVQGLLQVEQTTDGWELELRSAHGLRVDLTVDRLDGALEEVDSTGGIGRPERDPGE